MARFAILGAGSWGTALAILLHSNGHQVKVWCREPDVIEAVRSKGMNSKYLPETPVPETLMLTTDLHQAVSECEGLVVAVPSHAIRSVLERLPEVPPETLIISVAKGIENDTLLRVSQILMERFEEERIAVLSGPSHAEEVSKMIPTAVVCASKKLATAEWVQESFMSPAFRVYTHKDVIGVELGGALKNVIAVAAGIIDGVGAGDNTKAALITRALAEITRLGVRLGAQKLTFAGLSGMGDLIVTCMSRHSRNRYLGEQIGKGRTIDDILSSMVMVAEGVRTTKSAYELARRHNVDAPIITQTYHVLFENKDPGRAVYDLMTRAAKVEDWG